MAGGQRTTAGAGVGAAPTKASLAGPSGSVAFAFNPLKVTVSKSAKTEGRRGVVANTFQEAIKAVGNLTIKLSDVNFVGTTVKATCDTLIAWVTPTAVPGSGRSSGRARGGTTGSAGRAGGGLTGGGGATASSSATKSPAPAGFMGTGTIYELPVLSFMWGGGGGSSGFSYKVVLEDLSISYERFSPQGVPVWAKVNLTLKEYVDAPPLTNPTSGGEPGRTKHLVISGDSVVRIAHASYGTPAAWRAVAEVNGLDDPLRIRPGTVLDLPGVTELEVEAPA